jgi:pimeloyl-ACP methyl ester carboxylesterase
MSNKPSIVFAHGLWADGSCYGKVMKLLQADGYEVISTQNQLNTVEDDAAAVRTALGRVSSPSVLVGHSYGGTVITAAGTDDRVAALVYICALAPEEGENSQAEQDKHPKTAVLDNVEVVDGRVWLKRSGKQYFCGDLSAEDQDIVWATQTVPLADLFSQPVHGAAWKKKPSWYIVGRNDQTVHPDLERFVAKRMNAKITELDSSHVAMLSHPQGVYEVIREAAEAVERAQQPIAQAAVPTPA